MIDSKPLTMEDYPLFRSCADAVNSRNAWLSFGIPYLWDGPEGQNLLHLGDRVAVEWLLTEHSPFFTFPIGSGDLREPVLAMAEYAAAKGQTLTLHYVDEESREALEAALPGCFEFTEDRDEADYIYDISALSTLAGKKLHSKRNYCNRFEAAHEWRSVPLTPEHFPGCRDLLDRWAAQHQDSSVERAAVERAFDEWELLSLEGCVLLCEGDVAAFSIGEVLCGDTFVVHFEKAAGDLPGAYPMICREFARQIAAAHPGINYVNREEDMGLPNLRKAKEDWYPCMLLRKYVAVWKGDAE